MEEREDIMVIDPNKQIVVSENDCYIEGNDTSNEEDIITSPFDPSKIRVEPKMPQMDALIKRMKNNEIDLMPEFQRQASIWTDAAQSRLIESMLLKIPIPAFYIDASNEDRWIVIDGLQRLSAIMRFVIPEKFKELFPSSRKLKLVGLDSLVEYNGKTFDDLPRTMQRRIEETDLVLYLIQPGTPPEVKFDIFKRINTGGVPLNAQEIRHALNPGKICDYLKKLAGCEEYLKATDNSIKDKRMDGRECILRFLTFSSESFSPEKYEKKSFDLFLNKSMEAMNQLSDDALKLKEKEFKLAMNRAYHVFSDDAFRKPRVASGTIRHPINKALFEVWSVCFSKLSNDEFDRLMQKKETLINSFSSLINNDKEFNNAITQATGSIKNVRLRFERIQTLVQSIISQGEVSL